MKKGRRDILGEVCVCASHEGNDCRASGLCVRSAVSACLSGGKCARRHVCEAFTACSCKCIWITAAKEERLRSTQGVCVRVCVICLCVGYVINIMPAVTLWPSFLCGFAGFFIPYSYLIDRPRPTLTNCTSPMLCSDEFLGGKQEKCACVFMTIFRRMGQDRG